ncbi:DUF3618 domain-containing protein [Actinoplanes sp. NPDC051851]|uniref:DUF3618 domain-containing protein n=1 Tax=Actinoplanes sp. NPDC051851 TaxID=3154753 RepID=UPI00341C42D4
MSTPPSDPQQLRTEIAQTRADLGATVQALAAKTDVKARARHSAADLATRGRQQLAAARDRVAATTTAGAATARRTAMTVQSKAVETARRPKVRRNAVPVAALVLAAAGIALIIRGRRA